MPVRHGCYRLKEDGPLFFNFGMLNVSIGVVQAGRVTNQQAQNRALTIHHHLGRAISRLAFSLDTFQQAEKKWEHLFSIPFEEWGDHPDQIVMEVAADSIAHYLNVCFDDVWRIIPFVFDPISPDEPGGYGAFKKLLQRGKFAGVKPMFDQLDDQGSWWNLFLINKTGIRQRFVHYTDVINLQGYKRPNDTRAKVLVFVRSSEPSDQGIDFIAILRDSLKGFCNWLDKLEAILVDELSAQFANLGSVWTPLSKCPRILVPVGMQEGTREIPEDFLYLPECDGSLPTKGTSTLIIPKHAT